MPKQDLSVMRDAHLGRFFFCELLHCSISCRLPDSGRGRGSSHSTLVMRGWAGLVVFLLSVSLCRGHCHGNSLPRNVTGLGVLCECQSPNSVCYEEVAPASSGCQDPSSVSPFEHWVSGDCHKCICVGGPLQNSIDLAGLVVSGEWRAPRPTRHRTLHEPTHPPSHSARAGRLRIYIHDFCSVEVVP